MMNVLLIYPEFPDTYWSFKHALPIEGKKSAYPPLGLLTVASMMPKHWNKRLVDTNIRSLTDADLAWADVFGHGKLGRLGRIVLEGRDDGRTQVSCELAGDPADPVTAERRRIFEPLALELTRRVDEAAGPAPRGLRSEPLSRRPEPKELIESKLMQCERCNAVVAMLIFAPKATGPGRFEDYARKTYPEYALEPADLDYRPNLGERAARGAAG